MAGGRGSAEGGGTACPWRLRLEQRFVHRLWKVFEVTLRLELAYDRQQNAKLQYKQTLSLGVAYRW